MSNILFSFFLAFCILVFGFNEVWAISERTFDDYIKEWNQKIELASKYLKSAEVRLKAGDKNSACTMQKQASKYGIEALLALKEAIKINKGLEIELDLENNLNQWRSLGINCI